MCWFIVMREKVIEKIIKLPSSFSIVVFLYTETTTSHSKTIDNANVNTGILALHKLVWWIREDGDSLEEWLVDDDLGYALDRLPMYHEKYYVLNLSPCSSICCCSEVIVDRGSLWYVSHLNYWSTCVAAIMSLNWVGSGHSCLSHWIGSESSQISDWIHSPSYIGDCNIPWFWLLVWAIIWCLYWSVGYVNYYVITVF